MIIAIVQIGTNMRHLDLRPLEGQYPGEDTDDDPVQVKLPATIPCTLEEISFGSTIITEDSDVSGWDTSHLTGAARMFDGTPSIPNGVQNWDFSTFQNTRSMFRGANFGDDGDTPDLTGVDVSGAGAMVGMFEGSNFNQDITGWDVKAHDVTNMFKDSGMSQDLSSMVLPRIYFHESIKDGQTKDRFAEGSGMTREQYPKTAIEAGISPAPMRLLMDYSPFEAINAQGVQSPAIQVKRGGSVVLQGHYGSHGLNPYEPEEGDELIMYGSPSDTFYVGAVEEVLDWGEFDYHGALIFRSSNPTVPNHGPSFPNWKRMFREATPSANINQWDASHVTNLDNFLNPDADLDHIDLSGWSVPLITKEPAGWLLPPERSPVWGQ